MSKALYTIEIDEEVITAQVVKILNEVFRREMVNKYGDTGRTITDAVKDLVYSRKDEIIERVVDRATHEIVKKALPKLLDRMQGGTDGNET